MPPKRKANSQVPKDDPITQPTKRQQQPSTISTPTPSHADFGSAFASLLSAPAPKPITTSTTTTSTTVKTAPKTQPQLTTKTIEKKGKNDPKDNKKGNTKQDTKKGKGNDQKDIKKDKKDKFASNKEVGEISSKFLDAKNKRTTAVITVTREDSEKQRLASEYSKLQKTREREKLLLLEKDHVKPQYDETEKQLVRIATKGVVTLFQAVHEQTERMKDIQRNQQLSSTARDKIINEETQSGFLELLKQATENTANQQPVYVSSNKKKYTDLKSKLENDDEITLKDLKGIGLSDSDDDNNNEMKQKKLQRSAKLKFGIQAQLEHQRKSQQHNNDYTDSDSDQGEVIPKFKQKALQRQQQNGQKKVSKWSVIDDDYLSSKSTNKMKDWAKDDTSDSDL